MKVAVCVSGQPRSVKAGYEYLKKNLLPYHDVEFFVHTWNDKKGVGPFGVMATYEKSPANRDWRANQCQIDEYLNKDYINSRYKRVDNSAYPAYNTYSMWYSVFRANYLKKVYEDKHGFRFDAVIRTRFDYALNRKLDLDKIESGKVYVPNCRMTPGRNFCSDMFAYGKSDVMDLYANTYVNIDFLYLRGMVMNGEHMLSANLQAYGLVGDNMVYVDMNNPFPPGPYNGNYHSIIREDFDQYKAEGR